MPAAITYVEVAVEDNLSAEDRHIMSMQVCLVIIILVLFCTDTRISWKLIGAPPLSYFTIPNDPISQFHRGWVVLCLLACSHWRVS